MTRITEAIYTHGVLKPTADLELREQQRVRLIVESVEECGEELGEERGDETGEDRGEDRDKDRAAAVARLKAGIASMQFFSNGRLPTRDELHDRA